jgi:hypothetical protein
MSTVGPLCTKLDSTEYAHDPSILILNETLHEPLEYLEPFEITACQAGAEI